MIISSRRWQLGTPLCFLSCSPRSGVLQLLLGRRFPCSPRCSISTLCRRPSCSPQRFPVRRPAIPLFSSLAMPRSSPARRRFTPARALSSAFPSPAPIFSAEPLRGRVPAKLGPALSLSLCSCSPCRESLVSSPARLHFLRSLLQLYCRAQLAPAQVNRPWCWSRVPRPARPRPRRCSSARRLLLVPAARVKLPLTGRRRAPLLRA